MLLVGWQEGHPVCKKYGGLWTWALVSPDGVAPSQMVSVSASVNLPLHHKVQKFSSGTGSPGWSQKKGRKTVVVWCGLLFTCIFAAAAYRNCPVFWKRTFFYFSGYYLNKISLFKCSVFVHCSRQTIFGGWARLVLGWVTVFGQTTSVFSLVNMCHT